MAGNERHEKTQLLTHESFAWRISSQAPLKETPRGPRHQQARQVRIWGASYKFLQILTTSYLSQLCKRQVRGR